jgi:hypothetical protein
MSRALSLLRASMKMRLLVSRKDAKTQRTKISFAPLGLRVRMGVSGKALGLLLPAWLLLLSVPQVAAAGELRLLFTGDILMSRQVTAEMERTRRNPWEGWPPIFHDADWVVGNLEGAVGSPADCVTTSERSPCFAMPEATLKVVHQAGFRALSTANNHSGDLGVAGRRATRKVLIEEGLGALSFESSPAFWRFEDITLGVVAFSMVAGPDAQRVEVPSPLLRQKLRLARRLANLVVVYVHWGSELLDWPNAEQRSAAKWLAGQGADLIAGHHPHVVQPFECLQGKPVFYSLGNHLFDQKYPATKEGLIADCRVGASRLICGAIPTHTPTGSAFPRLDAESQTSGKDAGTRSDHCCRDGGNPSGFTDSHRCRGEEAALKSCSQQLSNGFTVAGYSLRPVPPSSSRHRADDEYVLEAVKDGKVRWKAQPVRLLAIDAGRLTGPEGAELLVTLERHGSPLDHEDSPRPYVYEVTARGLVARWRGTALAWPLLDAALLPGANGILCALHRGDSYLVPDPQNSRTRVAAYRWNGFGFSGVDDSTLCTRCAELFELPSTRASTP